MTGVPVLFLFLHLAATSNSPDESRYLRFDRAKVSSRPGGRRLNEDRLWEPIRVHMDTSALETQIASPAQRSYLQDDVLPAAGRWLSKVVRVLPVMGNLKLEQHCNWVSTVTKQCMSVAPNFQECGTTTIPREHFADKEYCPHGKLGGCETSRGGSGIPNADLVIYITALQDQFCAGSTVAYASVCRQAEDDRPVAGYLNFCLGRLAETRQWHQDVAVALHEIMHSMAFSSSLFPYFRDADGQPLTARDEWGHPPLKASSSTVREEIVDGQLRHFLVLPKVLQAAQHYFACDTLDGIPMEEQGGDGTAFSHWDARIMHTEVMSPESSTIPRISDLTLALLEDSGWYKVHGGASSKDGDSAAGAFFFGQNKGCSFVHGKCIVDQQSAFPDTFCTENQGSCSSVWAGSRSCSHDHMSVGLCTNCLHTENLPAAYQHFGNPRLGGFARYVGYCPTVEPFWFCKESTAYTQIASYRYGETLGASSRCVLSTVTEQGYQQPPKALGTCRNVFCEEGGLKIQIGSGEDFVECAPSDVGKRKDVSGLFGGYVLCPEYSTLCGATGAHGPRRGQECLFPGVMRHGRCVCPPGSLGADCSVSDTKENRQNYPFGLRYPQQEFLLKVGVPLSQSPGLVAWPVRPSLLDGPNLMSFRVSPELPYGLELLDGVLSGEPLASSPRQAYVIEAFSWTGSTTAVIFITVACEGAGCAATPPPTTSGASTASPTATTGAGSGTAVTVSNRPGLLLLALNVPFRELQQEPGLEVFAQEVKAVFQMVFYVDLTKVGISAADDGRAVIEAAVPLQRQPQLEEELRLQIADPASSLYSSMVGNHLRSATITSIGEAGVTKVWPPPSDDPMQLGWLDVNEWQDWLSSQPTGIKILIISSAGGLVMLCFLVCCRKDRCCCCCRKKKSGEQAYLSDNMDMHLPYSAPTTPTGWAPTPVMIGRTPPGPSAVEPAPTPNVDEAMEQMLGMGFGFEESKICLEANGWDVARASVAIIERQRSSRSFEMDIQVESATDVTDSEQANSKSNVLFRPNTS